MVGWFVFGSIVRALVGQAAIQRVHERQEVGTFRLLQVRGG